LEQFKGMLESTMLIRGDQLKDRLSHDLGAGVPSGSGGSGIPTRDDSIERRTDDWGISGLDNGCTPGIDILID